MSDSGRADSLFHGLRQTPTGGRKKRAFDIVLASTAMVLLSPLMLAVAASIKLTMGGPVFFSQRRVGYQGRSFLCYKFRTMVSTAEEALTQHLERNPAAAEEWKQSRKLRIDPRVTTLGYVLRKTSLDELPQLYNVLVGDMSCVGPRPIVEDETRYYGHALQYYIRTRPGITGVWQVSGRSNVGYEARVTLDTSYVQLWSFTTDLKIISKTFVAVTKLDESA